VKKPLPKWFIRFVSGVPRGTTLAQVGKKADRLIVERNGQGK